MKDMTNSFQRRSYVDPMLNRQGSHLIEKKPVATMKGAEELARMLNISVEEASRRLAQQYLNDRERRSAQMEGSKPYTVIVR